MKYSRLLRWLNQMKKTVDKNGNLNETYLAWCKSHNWSEADIEEQQLRLQVEYQRIKKLDEESPEEWIQYTAYEAIFTPEQRKQFNFDGTVNAEYAANLGKDMQAILEYESASLIEEIEYFNMMVKQWAAVGVNFAEDEKLANDKLHRNAGRPLNERELADLRNFEEISSLTIDIDPDDYNALTAN